MADPDHIAELDNLDIWTVGLYRTGLSIITVGFAWTAWLELSPAGLTPALGWLAVAAGTSLSAVNLHLYAKAIRWTLQMAAGTALPILLMAAVMPPSLGRDLLLMGGLALLCVAVCGFAFKEQFCFRLRGMWLLPVLLGISVMPFSPSWVIATALGFAALLYGYLALAKWRMPFHFDIGDKSKYQV